MTVDSWQAVTAADDAALRALVETGKPEQRVWAIWELALRVGNTVGSPAQRTAREPNTGVRRHVAIVLAGHGEVDLLVALGRHDPASEVRASAMQLATRLAAGGKLDHAIVLDSFAREGFPVRTAILGELAPGVPETLAELAAEALQRGDHDEQLEGFAAMLRLGTPEHAAKAIRWIANAKDMLAARAWMRWPQVVSSAALVEVIGKTPLAFRALAVRSLITPIEELAPVFAGGDQRLYETIRERADFATAPPELLARAILAGCAHRFIETLSEQLVKNKISRDLAVEVRDHCNARLAAIAAGQFLPDEPKDRWPARAHYSQLLTRVLRRIG